MRKQDSRAEVLFAYVTPESFVPKTHPLRAIRTMADDALVGMDKLFDSMYAPADRYSIPPEKLLKAHLLMILYSIRTTRQLVEQIHYNFLYRWFLDMSQEEQVWDHSSFSTDHERLIGSDIAAEFLYRVLALAERKHLLSREHFTVDGTLIEAWASVKSLKSNVDPPSTGGGKNETVGFKGKKLNNGTHPAVTDPEAQFYCFDITERKRVEEALRVSEARYLSIIEDQTELICRYLPDGRLTFVNGAYARYYGKSQAELINRNFVPNIPEPDLSIVAKHLAEISQDRPVAAFTHRIINADGEVRWQRWTQRGIYAADGSLLEYQAVGFDITERKLAEMIMQARLRISDYQFDHSLNELLTNILDEVEALTDSQIGFFHFLDANQVTLSQQTWSSRTLATMCTAEAKGHAYPLESAGVWCDCIREKRPVIHNNYESLPYRKGMPPGHAPVVRELVVPIFRNNLIVAVVGVGNKFTDYTNQDVETIQNLGNLAWDTVERKRTEEALRSTSTYARTLIEASLDPLVTISPDGTITDVNEASVRVTGVSREQLIGTDFSAYFTDPDNARRVYLQVFSEGFVHDYPLAIRNVSGGITDVLYNASIYRDEQGRVKGVFAAARDVTERNRALQALKLAHDQLEARVAERTSALALANEKMKKVSFELVWAEERERERIAGELHDQVGQSLLLTKMKLDALADQISHDSLRSYAEDAAALVETSIHDIRSLTFRMRPPLLDTAGIDTALEWLSSSLRNDYHLHVDYDNDCHPRPLSAEVRYSLYQAVRELLLNVVKHAKTETALLSVKSDDHTLVVHVADNGVGFAYPDAGLKDVNSSGYGLYNVQLRIEQMGGCFAIESAPGRGTTVTLRVPFG